ncbi:uncharacterized protein ISCGN_002545 [Ixodes scapularis]
MTCFTITTIMLMMLFCSSLLATCYSSNPTEQFFKDTETRPILLYECYQSGNSIDAPGTSNLTVLYDGTSKITKIREGATWSATKGTTESYVVDTLYVHYNEKRSIGVIFSFDGDVYFTVLEPFESETLYLKIYITSPYHTILYKIFDEDFECENAKELLKKVCPDPCDMTLSRELSSD